MVLTLLVTVVTCLGASCRWLCSGELGVTVLRLWVPVLSRWGARACSSRVVRTSACLSCLALALVRSALVRWVVPNRDLHLTAAPPEAEATVADEGP